MSAIEVKNTYIDEVAVRYHGESDRHKAIEIIQQWCFINNIIAVSTTKRYMSETSYDGKFVTTFWSIPDEKQRMFFILRWCK